jgi:hypothetical protein
MEITYAKTFFKKFTIFAEFYRGCVLFTPNRLPDQTSAKRIRRLFQRLSEIFEMEKARGLGETFLAFSRR